MDFLGVGPGELFLILIIALLVLGPGKLPEVGRTLGRFVRELRKTASDFTADFGRELNLDLEEGKRERGLPLEAPRSESTIQDDKAGESHSSSDSPS